MNLLLDTLVVEDNPGDRRLVVEMLRDDSGSEFRLTHVTTAGEAVEHLARRPDGIDAVLLDLSLPDESGLDTVRRIVAAAGRAVVVVMTGFGDDEVGKAAVQHGAQDYLVKGHVDASELRRALLFAVERRHQLERQSLRDELTGLHNRRGFFVMAQQQLTIARRDNTPFLVLFMDLDQLKLINDTLGHSEGDRALAEAGDVLRRCFRQDDVVARLGGDEFAAMAIGSAEADDHNVRRRLDGALRSANGQPNRKYPLDFSVGLLSCSPDEGGTIQSLLERADRMMYEVKRKKRGHLTPALRI